MNNIFAKLSSMLAAALGRPRPVVKALVLDVTGRTHEVPVELR